MSILVSLLAFSALCGIRVNSDKQKRYYLALIIGLMVIFAGLRAYNVGKDTIVYAQDYASIAAEGWSSAVHLAYKYEWGYLIYCYLLSRLFSSPTVMFFVSAMIIYGSVCWLFYRYSDNVPISMFLYLMWFYPTSMNTMRQYIATAFIYWSFLYIERKKIVPFLVLVGLAASFHTTASIFLVLAVFCFDKIKLDRKLIIVTGGVGIISLNFFTLILDRFLGLFGHYARFLNSRTLSAQSEVSIFWVVVYISIAVFFVYYEEKDISKSSDINHLNENSIRMKYLFCLLHVVSIVLFIFTGKLWIINRMNSYFRQYICLIFPSVIVHLEKKFRPRFVVPAVFYIVFFVFAWSMYLADGHGLFPFNLVLF